MNNAGALELKQIELAGIVAALNNAHEICC
jgi:hypothetical protein